MPDELRSKFLPIQRDTYALDLTDDEIAAHLGSQIAHIITHKDDATPDGVSFSFLAMTPAIFVRHLPHKHLAIPPLATGVLASRVFGDWHSEEDTKIGMLFMSEAGFNPAAAISLERKLVEAEKRKTGIIIAGTRDTPVSSPAAIYEI